MKTLSFCEMNCAARGRVKSLNVSWLAGRHAAFRCETWATDFAALRGARVLVWASQHKAAWSRARLNSLCVVAAAGGDAAGVCALRSKVARWTDAESAGIIAAALRGGHVALAATIVANTSKYAQSIMCSALYSGHVPAAKFARHIGCELNLEHIRVASVSGNIKMLEWVFKQLNINTAPFGVPDGPNVENQHFAHYTTLALIDVSGLGYTNIVKLLLPLADSEHLYISASNAAVAGHVDVVDLIYAKSLRDSRASVLANSARIMHNVIKRGTVAMLSHLITNWRVKSDIDMCKAAMRFQKHDAFAIVFERACDQYEDEPARDQHSKDDELDFVDEQSFIDELFEYAAGCRNATILRMLYERGASAVSDAHRQAQLNRDQPGDFREVLRLLRRWGAAPGRTSAYTTIGEFVADVQN